MVRLIAVDMDGTFLNDNKQKSPEYGKVIDFLRRNNIYFCVASGRQLASLKKEMRDYQDHVIFVAENGTVVEMDDEIIMVEELSRDITHSVIDKVNGMNNKKLVYCAKDCSYIDLKDEQDKKNAEQYLPSYKIVDNFYNLDDLPVKISIYSKTGYDSDFDNIVNTFGDIATVCTSGFEWLDVIPKRSSKGNAIKKIQKILGISKKETMAFGDQMNDFEMLSEAYYSYAMDNAVEKIKQISRFSAPSNNEFGVIQILKKHFNID